MKRDPRTKRSLITATGLLLFLASPLTAQQTYPNVTGEVLLDDDRVIVQRFVLQPGQWEGIHEHPEYQLVVVLQPSGEVTMKFGDNEPIIRPSSQSRAFWRPGPVTLSQQHESGNTGTRPLEWIAITFKKESIAAETAGGTP